MIDTSKIKIEEIKYHEVIEGAKEKVCIRYNSGYTQKRKNAEEDEKNDIAFVYRTLSMATSFTLNPENVMEPFHAMMVMQGSRTAIPDDFSENQLKLINIIIDDTNDSELRARLADVTWIRKHEFERIKIAIGSYLDSADHLLNDNLSYAIDRLERAIRIANSLGKGGKNLFDQSIKKAEAFIDIIDHENTSSILRIMKLLLEFDEGKPKKYTALTKDLVKEAESIDDWRKLRRCWEINARWQSKLNKPDGKRSSLIKAADTYVKEAEAATTRMAAASFYQKAIQAHRKIGGQQERTEELHELLLEVQKGIKDEMGSFSKDINISKLVSHAQYCVANKEFQDALFSTCLLVEPLKVERLKKRTQKLANEHPMQFVISGTLLDEQGKTIAEYPEMLSNNPEEREKALYAHTNQQAQHDIQINVAGLINPARKQLLLDHRIKKSDFYELVHNNPLVPPGREHLFTKGLYDGFIGDFVSSINILVTQFEHSMRYILNDHGVITSGLNDKKQQDDRSLNMTLGVEELEEIFGEDIAFTLRTLLINKFGSNLRNKVAHGLMGYHSYYSASAIYLWSFILRLICWPYIVEAHKTGKFNESG